MPLFLHHSGTGIGLCHRVERDLALDVVRQLRHAGFEALWAGGCVRDLLLGHEPTDYDVATSATPLQVREIFGRRRTLPVGMSFGVVIVLGTTAAGGQIDVATFRTDASYSDGRRPDAVTFSSPREDAQRRDFTINGMFYDPLTDSVLDYVGGQVDLQRGLVRAIGLADERIAEDKLRMLRAIRIAARFGFDIERDTRSAIVRHASEVCVVSGERIWMEMRKTLESSRPAWGVGEWAAAGLMEYLLPQVAKCWPERAAATLRMLAAAEEFDWLTRFCGLLWQAIGGESDRVATAVGSLRARLKLANDVSSAVRFCLTAQAMLMAAEGKAWSEVQPVLAHPEAERAVALFELLAKSAQPPLSGGMLHTANWLRQQLAGDRNRLDPPPLLLGGDLIEAGLKPGPRFKQLLERARQMQLDQALVDRQSALVWLNAEIAKI